MFKSKSTKMAPSVKRMLEAQGKPEMGNPAIRFGQGDKNAPVTFFYGKNADTQTVSQSN